MMSSSGTKGKVIIEWALFLTPCQKLYYLFVIIWMFGYMTVHIKGFLKQLTRFLAYRWKETSLLSR